MSRLGSQWLLLLVKSSRPPRPTRLVPVLLAVAAAAVACGTSGGGSFALNGDSGAGSARNQPNGDAGTLLGIGGSLGASSGADDGGGVPPATGPVTDFPAPIFDGNAPPGSPQLFGSPDAAAPSGGPCLSEPEIDSLYPENWLRPRFTWSAVNGENLFELRLHVANQLQDLLVYTTNTTWTMPALLWDALRTHSNGVPGTVTITVGVLGGSTLADVAIGTSGSLGVAPAQATGAIVYWTTSGNSALKGFQPGDESVVTVLTPPQVASTVETVPCIGCHASTPDGEYAGFGGTNSATSQWPNGIALIDQDAGVVGAAPPFLGAGGIAALKRYNQGIETFSPAHWTTGDRREIVSYDGTDTGTTSTAVLSWIDLEATSTTDNAGVIARGGDSNGAGAPAWSHDGATIAYVSTNKVCDGRLGAGCDNQTYNGAADPGSIADLYTVPYAGGAGGTATPVSGASDPSVQEYYPAWSPDDALLAFNVVPNGLNLYDQAQSEISVVAASGGTPTRLEANSPPACTGKSSPGITNSWPKWSPTATTVGGATYYWLIFSSTRSSPGNPQLYVTSVVRQVDGTLATHGAVYLWNQPAAENNHTPAWDSFKVPPQAPPPK